MAAPHDSPASAAIGENSMMPAFRSYISVELPFAVTPIATTSSVTLHGADHQISPDHARARLEIEAFLPATFAVPCLHRATPQQTMARDDAGEPDGARGNAEELEAEEESDDEAPSRSSDGSSESDESADPSTAATRAAAQATHSQGIERSGLRLLTRHPRHYCTVPIFSGWRSTKWEGSDSEEDEKAAATNPAPGGSENAHLRAQKRRRREVFASTEPQLLIHGFYRNDLLLQVRQRRLIRRYRDPVTNALLREEEVEGVEDERGRSKTDDADVHDNARTRTLSAEVVGVVSREMELARPADFTFALFTPEQLRAAPSLCGADVFPPQHFLSSRATFEVRYEPGRDPNTAVTTTCSAAAPGDDTLAVDAVGDPAAAQYDFTTLPTISISAEGTGELPTRQAAHETFLRSMGSSLDGSLATDPHEVQMMVRLLAERPSWIVQDLQDAMLQSGLCPRAYRNKQIMQCFTYLIRNGPFNRLRLRLGYDPYASASSVVYERITVRLSRRSDVGVRLRDVSRSPHIESVLQELLERDKARRVEYNSLPGHARRMTLLEMQCRTIRRGQLYIPFQLIDVMDDPCMADAVRGVVAAAAPLKLEQRGQRRVWLSEAAYSRIMVYFTESLAALLEKEVEPRLRKLQGEDSQTMEEMKDTEGSASSLAGDDDSVMSYASGGDVSDVQDD